MLLAFIVVVFLILAGTLGYVLYLAPGPNEASNLFT
jgi:hypothetical protein